MTKKMETLDPKYRLGFRFILFVPPQAAALVDTSPHYIVIFPSILDPYSLLISKRTEFSGFWLKVLWKISCKNLYHRLSSYQ